MSTRPRRNCSRRRWVSLASWQPQRKPDAPCPTFQQMTDNSSPFRSVPLEMWLQPNPLSPARLLHINLQRASTRAMVLKGRLSRTGQGVSVFVIFKRAGIPAARRIFRRNVCPTLLLLRAFNGGTPGAISTVATMRSPVPGQWETPTTCLTNEGMNERLLPGSEDDTLRISSTAKAGCQYRPQGERDKSSV